MSVIKCKMCGGDLNLVEGSSVAVCEYCGSQQTVPAADNEKKLTLFARANRLRLACEFDKAAGVYESIVADFPTEAEAYWGLVLCRYGIEYVDDPATGKKIPTCHRSSFDSVMEDSDFEQALENADAVARRVYRDEAKAIEELRRGIVEVSGKEPPYDIFICYKETAEDGQRTVDSVIAQDVYDALTEKGYRVFFSRISLEDKLGTEYEPYIFAALHSAKIMLAFGTDYEYYNAVWVKNEWSRFLQLMTKDKSKHLIPCYKGIDAYDMPKEFAKLQAQDMGKVGAMQDLLRGVDKIMGGNSLTAATAQSAENIKDNSSTINALLGRVYLFLEDRDKASVIEYCNRILDMNPKCSEVYLILFLLDFGVWSIDEITASSDRIRENRNYQRAEKYASPDVLNQLVQIMQSAKDREESARNELAKRTVQFEEKAKKYREYMQATKDLVSVTDNWGDRVVALKSDGTVLASGENREGGCQVQKWKDIYAVKTDGPFTVGLKMDGTAVSCGEESDDDPPYNTYDVSKWTDVVSLRFPEHDIAGVKSNGELLLRGKDKASYRNNVVQVVRPFNCNYKLMVKDDGTVECVGEYQFKEELASWQDIVQVMVYECNHRTDFSYAVGLKKDGTIIYAGNKDALAYDSKSWAGIVEIIEYAGDIIGLRSDGTLVMTGIPDKQLLEWHDIVSIKNFPLAQKADGTVCLYLPGRNFNPDFQDEATSEFCSWKDIVSVYGYIRQHYNYNGDDTYCYGAVVGLKEDGTLISWQKDEQLKQPEWPVDVRTWRLFDNIDCYIASIPQRDALAKQTRLQRNADEEKMRMEKRAAKKKAAEDKKKEDEKRKKSLTSERISLQNELANLKGLFSGKRRREIERRLAEIEKELEHLK